MKATGIIRRIDDLGRVVIPKEIRRTLHIKEGDPLEIYSHEGAVCFKKYDVYETPNSIIEDFRNSIISNDEDFPVGKRKLIYDKIAELKDLLKEDNE